MIVDLNDIRITLDPSVKRITEVACMAISGIIENGIILVGEVPSNIIVYRDKIDFGSCKNQELANISGFIFTNFYKEYNKIIYRFSSTIKCSFWNNTLNYEGVFPPQIPDNEQIFKLIYPRFA